MSLTLKPYPEYKDSGILWLGEIPSHWEIKRLKHTARINPSKAEAREVLEWGDSVAFLPMERVGSSGEIDAREILSVASVWNGFTYFRKSDVLIAKITPCFENGKGACLDSLPTAVGFGSTEFIVARAERGIRPQFLYRITTLSEFRTLGADEMTGSAGQQRVPPEFVSNFVSAIPTLEEQDHIINFLVRTDQIVNSLIRAKQRLIELLNEQKQAIIHQAVTRGLNPDVPVKPTGLDWLPEVPEHWEISKLKHVAQLRSGDSITSSQINETDAYPVFGGNGLRGYTSDYTHEGEYVLIGRQGALCGNVNYASEKFWASEHAVVASPIRKQDVFWFGELLRAMNLNQYSQSAAQPGLSVERIENLDIPVPDYFEQKRISDWISAETSTVEAAIARVHREIELIREYRTRLISDVVTGKLDVRDVELPDPNEQEPNSSVMEPIDPKAPNNNGEVSAPAFDNI